VSVVSFRVTNPNGPVRIHHAEENMRFTLARMLAVVGLAGCGGHGGHTERIGPAKDTVVTPRQTEDTTIVTTDTTVKVDTMDEKGQEAIPPDSGK